MTDTNSEEGSYREDRIPFSGGLGPVPPALSSGYIVILKAPEIEEYKAPDWFPIPPDRFTQWMKALHG